MYKVGWKFNTFIAFGFRFRKFLNWNICFLNWKYSSIFHLEKIKFCDFCYIVF